MQNETEGQTVAPSESPLDGLVSEVDEVPDRTAQGGKPWGAWSTVGFGVLIVALWSVAQAVVGAMLTGQRLKASDAISEGWTMAWMTIIGAPIVVGAAVLLARLRKGISVAATLGLPGQGLCKPFAGL